MMIDIEHVKATDELPDIIGIMVNGYIDNIATKFYIDDTSTIYNNNSIPEFFKDEHTKIEYYSDNFHRITWIKDYLYYDNF